MQSASLKSQILNDLVFMNFGHDIWSQIEVLVFIPSPLTIPKLQLCKILVTIRELTASVRYIKYVC
jgi:hypothetical protein